MWPRTKPARTRPERAMTTFFPIEAGRQQEQQELADIFDQELEKMASRYETANQASQQQGDRQVDELLEKLKELARRQEQEAERQRRRSLDMQQGGGASGGGSGSSGGSAQQRALAEQAEGHAVRCHLYTAQQSPTTEARA